MHELPSTLERDQGTTHHYVCFSFEKLGPICPASILTKHRRLSAKRLVLGHCRF